MNDSPHPPPHDDFTPYNITRPDVKLLHYFIVISVLSNIALPIVLTLHLIKFYTLQYTFDEKGISMRWGFLFRKEILLTYRRIQDIHVTRNVIQRWFGLATVAVQTASATSGAEMSIVGILEAEELRDFLYQRMRGVRGKSTDADDATNMAVVDKTDQALVLLREIRDAVHAIRPQGDGVA